jgi:SanA protein
MAGAQQRVHRRLLLAAVAMVLVAAVAWVGPNAWVARATRPFVYHDARTVPARAFAIVPGSRVYRGKPFFILTARLTAALELYQSGRVKAILVSGNDTAESPEVTAMRTWLRDRGVPAADVWSDGGGTRTRETMNRAAAYFGVSDAVVCTQSVNMARSLYLARQAGIDAVGLSLPTELVRSNRYLAVESMKTSLAFAETQLRARPSAPAPTVAVLR